MHLILPVLLGAASAAHAAGLGSIQVESALGQPLRARIALIGADSAEVASTCVKATVSAIDGTFLSNPQVGLMRGASAASISLASRQAIQEPAIVIAVELGCTTPIRREFQVLLDPPEISRATSANPSSSSGKRKGREAPAPVSEDINLPDVLAQPQPPKPAAVKNPVKPAPERPSRPRSKAPPPEAGQAGSAVASPRSVLRLSGDDLFELPSMRLSETLSESNPALEPQKREELKAAQQRFIAELNGEDAGRGLDKNAKAQIDKQLDVLERQLADLGRIAAQQRESEKNTTAIIYALAGLLALSLCAIGWLVWRLRSMHQARKRDWMGEADVPVLEEQVEAAGQPGATRPATTIQRKAAVDEPEPLGLASEPRMAFDEPQHTQPLGKLTKLENTISQLMGTTPRLHAMDVEEISDVSQQAEFWISLNDPHRAIEILEPYGMDEHPESPIPWLYLLDLYYEVENRPRYDAMRELFMTVFNAYIPEYDMVTVAAEQSRCLEDFPYLINRICDGWPSPEVMAYMEGLLIDDRDGTRTGFELPVYRDILLLIAVLRERNRAPADGELALV